MGDQVASGRSALILELFGSIGRSSLSLYSSISGGRHWSEVCDVIQHVGPSYAFLFLSFICFCQLSLLNILTALFIENALRIAKPSSKEEAINKHKEELDLTEELRKL